MSEVKHTPGPWLIHSALLGHMGDVFSPTATKVTDCHHIARCFAPKPTEPILSDLHALAAERDAVSIIEANARLIAAAPAMLEALKAAVSQVHLTDRSEPMSPDVQRVFDQCCAAIAKAEGRS